MMSYHKTSSPILEIRARYLQERGNDAIASEVLRITDELLAIASTLPESDTREMIDFVRGLIDQFEKNMAHTTDDH